MIEIEDIKPIPKYILNMIQKVDKKYYPKPNGHNRFYKYYTRIKGELCEVSVAVRNYYKKWFCKQVVIHGINSKLALVRDIDLVMGFICIGWYRDGITKTDGYYDYDWSHVEDKYFSMRTALPINKEYILTIPKYKYSAVTQYKYSDILHYLKLYEKYPQSELLVKCGLSELATSKQILKRCSKDKNFCKWLFSNRDEIIRSRYYISSLLTAYKKNKSIQEIYEKDYFLRTYIDNKRFKTILNTFGKNEKDKLINYITREDVGFYSYCDYFDACIFLNLNLTENKNKYPHDFKKWHDIRIDEMHTKQAEIDAKKRKELYKQFSIVANKYELLERNLKDNYVCIIAKSPSDLIKEGNILCHCVGRMNYDQKFAREESLIFFIRDKNNPETPLVTLEYSIKNHKVLQCYGEHDSKPCDEILNYVNKIWLPYANRKIKKVA